ncbi:MAG: kinesin light chain KLC [Candidatus Scalindua rubra]|uniref:Kinesin light chain KLC n=1 Tax=Candidatus Scalindua rubra TaxID=1872076 RepID=A0A1E3X2W8_9BACT|nr:MAG: kinesin light chain KLC [Candidatus Scalindua rubra]
MKKFLKTLLFVLALSFLSTSLYAQEKLWNELNAQANSLYQQGRYKEAVNVVKDALKVAEKTFGSNHPNVAQKDESAKGKREEKLDNTLDDSDKITHKLPEYTIEEQTRLNVVKTKLMKEPLDEKDLEIVREVQKSYTKRTGILITEIQARKMMYVTEIIFSYEYELGRCYLISFDTKKPYISEELKWLRKKMESLVSASISKLDADFKNINSAANNEVCIDEYGNEHPPLTREDIFKVIENAEILKTNIEKYTFALTNYDSKSSDDTNVHKKKNDNNK